MLQLDARLLAQRAHEELRRLILAGELAPGPPIAGDALALGRASSNHKLCLHLERIDGRVQLLRLTRCRDPALRRANTARHGAPLDAIAAGNTTAATTIAHEHARSMP